MVHERGRTKTERKISITNQVTRRREIDGKLLRVDADVHRGTEQRRVAEEGVQRADNEDEVLAGVGPLRETLGRESLGGGWKKGEADLEGVVRVVRRDGVQRLAVACVVALC